jgi:carbon-monoxide dehydrogenase large subunit
MRAPFRRRRDFRKSASARGIWRSRCVKRYACAAATEFRRTRSEYCQRTRQPNSNPMPQSIGKPLRRKEDLRLLTGGGRYSDDVNLPGQAYAYVLRSPHAHARIRRIDTTAARAIPGVLAVLTGADVTADGLKDIPHTPIPMKPPADILLVNRDGSEHGYAPQDLLPTDRVRYVGQQVAMVVAETVAQAKDATERIVVEYEALDPVIAGAASVQSAAMRLYDQVANVCVDADVGNIAATQAAFDRASRFAKLRTTVQRVTGVPLDLRAAVGVYDSAAKKYTLHAGSGGVVRQKAELAGILGVPPSDVRVECGDVGGNYGTRNAFYPEFALVVWAAKRLGRPVKWTCERSEAFASDYQGRDQTITLELALDQRGKFLAVRGEVICNVGAHSVMYVPLVKCSELLTSVYQVPAAHIRARAALTNTVPTSPYRSAGRPEAMFAVERLIDIAARQFGYDRIDLRRRNLIPPSAQPYPNPLGMTYDSGDYAKVMDQALELADWKNFNKRKRESKRNGKLRGIGLANYIESTSGAPREYAKIDVLPEGRIDVTVGTLSSGQGHETSFAQCVGEWLGVNVDDIRLIQGDTDIVPVGGGSHSARSMRMGGVVMGKASEAVIRKATKIAGHVMEADAADISFAEGRFTVKGTDRSIGLFEAAKAARERSDLPADLKGPLAADCDDMIRIAAFPFGCAVCEVEIDPDTGKTEIVGYTSVDDVGRAINPLILHGQAHGAIVQGVGQAMWEHSHYDPTTGQLLAGSMMDYAMPRAPMLPSFITELSETLAPGNPLGVRGGGEGGTTPALAVVVNAVVDALSDYGVTHLEMPLTAERVWRAVRDGKHKAA